MHFVEHFLLKYQFSFIFLLMTILNINKGTITSNTITKFKIKLVEKSI